MTNTARAFSLAFLAGTAFSTPATAQTLPPVISHMLNAWETQTGSKPELGAVADDGNGTLTIDSIKGELRIEGKQSGSYEVGKTVLSGVGAEADGSIEIKSGTMADSRMRFDIDEGQPVSITIPLSSFESYYIPVLPAAPGPIDLFRSSVTMAKKFVTGPMTVNFAGSAYTSEGIETTWTGDPRTASGDYGFTVHEVTLPEATLALLDRNRTLKSLGYTNVGLSGKVTYTMAVEEKVIGLKGSLTVRARDMAGIVIDVDAANVPIAALNEMSAASKANREPKFDTMMADIEKITINSARLRFEDASITGKALPMIAQRTGMNADTLKANAGAMAQAGLMQFQHQGFTEQAVNAINAYLAAPKSFSLTAKPPVPVTFAQLVALDPTKPADAINLLGVALSAND